MNELKIYEQFLQAQKAFKSVGKNAEGYGYYYATLADILEMAMPALNSSGLSLMQFPTMSENQLKIKTVIQNQSGEKIEHEAIFPMIQIAKLNAMQNMGACISYARRYSLTSILGLAEIDNDTQDIKEENKIEKSCPSFLNLVTLINSEKSISTTGKIELMKMANLARSNEDECKKLIEKINKKIEAQKPEEKREDLF